MAIYEIKWFDIAYFSKGAITANDEGNLVINVNRQMTPETFIGELLDAASECQLTLNSIRPLEEQEQSFPVPTRTPLVLNASQQIYSQTINYVVSRNVTIPQDEVEG